MMVWFEVTGFGVALLLTGTWFGAALMVTGTCPHYWYQFLLVVLHAIYGPVLPFQHHLRRHSEDHHHCLR